ncbi:hypothetical protein ACWD6P_35570 [Streptomyces sp. NPDC002446]
MIRAFLKRRRERRRAATLKRLAAHFDAQLGAAADIAISRARRTASPTERGSVLVEDVSGAAHEHFGLAAIPPEKAAAALRARYELRAGAFDLDTDAYTDSSMNDTEEDDEPFLVWGDAAQVFSEEELASLPPEAMVGTCLHCMEARVSYDPRDPMAPWENHWPEECALLRAAKDRQD